tara:strand:- start:180 stop:425 length:246 start_codon:yes stop_codon:yes gene_type:complete
MTKTTDNYSAFNDLNLSNARDENETYETYKKRLKQNKHILKTYFTVGREAFKQMFPGGVGEALKNSAEQAINSKKEDAKIK